MREDSLTIGWQSDWAFASSARFGWWQHRPPLLNYSLGNAIIRHKGLSFASALWKPGDINCRGSLPSPFLPPSWEFSTAPAAHIQHFHPHPPTPSTPANPSSTNWSSEYSPYYVFCSHTVLSCVLAAKHPSISLPPSPLSRVPYGNSSHRRLLPNTFAHGERNPKTVSKMFAGTREVF